MKSSSQKKLKGLAKYAKNLDHEGDGSYLLTGTFFLELSSYGASIPFSSVYFELIDAHDERNIALERSQE